MERSQAIKDFIREHQALFWYSPEDKCETVSDELLVETILNYGTFADIRKMFKIMNMNTVVKIFHGMTGRKSQNIYPEIHNFFERYFERYAS